MPKPGRPRALDPTKQVEICTFVATGVSIREAARLVGSNANTVRNEARRNERFRADLQQARSQAQMHPLRTMQQAAATNWRAAAWWLERIAPEAFAQSAAAVLGQREANNFARDLFEIIERVVSNPLERDELHELVEAALPAAMRRTWDHRQSRRKLERAIDHFDGKPTNRATADPPKSTQPPEPRTESRIERLLASFNEQLRQSAPGARRPAQPINPESGPANDSPPADNSFAPPEKQSVNSFARHEKTSQ